MTALEYLTALLTMVQTASLQRRALYLRTSSLRDFLRLLKMQLLMLVQALTQDSLSRKRWKNFLSAATMTQKLIFNNCSFVNGNREEESGVYCIRLFLCYNKNKQTVVPVSLKGTLTSGKSPYCEKEIDVFAAYIIV